MRREAKQSSVLSPAIFNNVIGCVIGRIPHFLIELSIDQSHLSYADDILLLSDNMQSLQATVNSLYAGLSIMIAAELLCVAKQNRAQC